MVSWLIDSSAQLDHDDVKTLASVSKRAHAALGSRFWEAIGVAFVREQIITGNWHQLMDSELATRCASALHHPTTATHHATQLAFRCKPTKYVRRPCLHPRSGIEERPGMNVALELCFDQIAAGAKSIIESLDEGQLHEFMYEPTGTPRVIYRPFVLTESIAGTSKSAYHLA